MHIHVIQSNDTLWALANRIYSVTIQQTAAASGLSVANTLVIAQTPQNKYVYPLEGFEFFEHPG